MLCLLKQYRNRFVHRSHIWLTIPSKQELLYFLLYQDRRTVRTYKFSGRVIRNSGRVPKAPCLRSGTSILQPMIPTQHGLHARRDGILDIPGGLLRKGRKLTGSGLELCCLSNDRGQISPPLSNACRWSAYAGKMLA
jgi:hypothetical protein